MRTNLDTIRRRLLEDESGVAIIVVMGVILVGGLLAAAAISASTNLVRSSVKDTRNTRALAAANAGLDTAVYRLQRNTSVLKTECLTSDTPANVALSSSTSPPVCRADTWRSLGNGTYYKFYISPSYDATFSGQQLTNMNSIKSSCGQSPPSFAGERCITAVGLVGDPNNSTAAGNVQRRLQVRTAGLILFPTGGMMGIQGASWSASNNWGGSNPKLDADIGTNGPLLFGANVDGLVSGRKCYTPSGADCPPTGGGGGGGGVNGSGVGAPLTVSAASTDTLDFPRTAASNNNGVPALAPYYTAAGRLLNIPTGTVDLPAGDYNFCSVKLGNGAALRAQAGAAVRIFVDSIRRDTVQGVASNCLGGVDDGRLFAGAETANSTTPLTLTPTGNTTNGSTTIALTGGPLAGLRPGLAISTTTAGVIPPNTTITAVDPGTADPTTGACTGGTRTLTISNSAMATTASTTFTVPNAPSAVASTLDGTGTGRLEIYIYGTKAPTPKGTPPVPPTGCLSGRVSPPTGDGSNRYLGRDAARGCGDDFEWNFAASIAPQNVYVYAPNSNVMITATNQIANSAIMACTTTLWAAAATVGFSTPPLNQRPIGRLNPLGGSFKECRTVGTLTDVSYAQCSG